MRLDRRFLGPMALIAVAAAGLLVWVSTASHRDSAHQRAVEQLSREAELLAVSAHLLTGESAQAYAIRTSTNLGARLTLIGPTGIVVADSAIDSADIPQMDNHMGRPEIEAANLRGSGVSQRRSDTTEVRYWYVAHRVDVPGPVRFVRLAVRTSDLPDPPWYSGWPVLATAFASMLFLVAFAGVAVHRMSKSLNALSDTLERDSGGATASVDSSPVERLAAAVRHSQVATLERVGQLDSKGATLSAVISGMKEGLLVVGSDRRIELTNAAIRDILGLSFDPTGRLVAEVIRHPTVMRDVEAALEEQREIRESIVTVESSGRAFELQISPMRSAEDDTVRLLVLFFDVTRLQALDGIRREFVGNVSHELRTPLTSITAFVETLLEGDLKDPVANRRFLEIVRKHAGRMNALLDDLTDLSAIETGSVRLERRELDVHTVVTDIVDQLGAFAKAREVAVAVDVPEGMALLADPGRLEQVLTNLIHNAIKFNRPHGTVTIRGDRDGNRVRLTVQDTGAGIPADSHDKIFNRFYQLDKARSREHGGTGLGLAIVKHLMRLHGGSVRVESELGSGATFILDFPTADPARS